MRDALGIVPPVGLADAFLEPVTEALTDLVSRFARTHTPFTAEDVAARFGLGTGPVLTALNKLAALERVIEGEFLPHELRGTPVAELVRSFDGHRNTSQVLTSSGTARSSGREWCDVNVLRTLQRRTLAALRKEVEPVEPKALARFLPDWHGITRPRRGLDGLLDTIEQLQGAPLPASTLENEILPARVTGFRPSDLDELCAAGEIVWQGCDSTATGDGRIALYLTDRFPLLSPPVDPLDDDMADKLRSLLREQGALFFAQICGELRGFPNDMLDLLWQLVWRGEVTNDTLTPLRSLRAGHRTAGRSERRTQRTFRSRRQNHLPGSEGRWTMLGKDSGFRIEDSGRTAQPNLPGGSRAVTVTERQTAIAAQLIERHGIVTKEMLAREDIVGGFAGLYPVLKAMEEAGKVRRGYFVAGLGAAQFAAHGAEDRLREHRDSGGVAGQTKDRSSQSDPIDPAEPPGTNNTLVLAATDPANPWGSVFPWPETSEPARPQRVAGAKVIIHDGELLAYLGRTRQTVTTFTGGDASSVATQRRLLAMSLATLAVPGRSMLLTKVDGIPTAESLLTAALLECGFTSTTKGFLHKGRTQV